MHIGIIIPFFLTNRSYGYIIKRAIVPVDYRERASGMKRMQCEICGSTEIKKTSNSVFECQCCGVQYDAAEVRKLLVEVSGKIKIDHSDEVENNIKRAKQYEQAGDDTKATAYYNAALDMDADNDVALTGVKEIAERHELDEYFIIDPNVDPLENMRHFFEQLATIENIACDIYKEIEIKSVKEKFIPFCFMKAEYQCDWSATACRIYFENETVYKEEYDAQLKRRVSRPVTEKVQKVERIPRSGSHTISRQELAFASDGLRKFISVEKETNMFDLLADFESLQDSKYATYKPHKIDHKTIQRTNGNYFYQGMELDTNIDKRVCSDKKQRMAKRATEEIAPKIQASVGGDYYEDMHAVRNTLSESIAYICIPVQIIAYTYKGKNYMALSDLLSRTTTMPLIYPGDAELKEEKEAIQQASAKSKQLPLVFWLGILCAILGLVFMVRYDNSYNDSDFICFMGLLIASVVLMIAGVIVRSKQMSAVDKRLSDAKLQLRNPRKIALFDSFALFMAEYHNYADLSAAKKAAATISICIEKTYPDVYNCCDIQEVTTESSALKNQELEILRLESEIAVLKKKTTLPTILMVVFWFLIIPCIVGAIMLGNINAKINKKVAELNKIKADWIDT